VSARVRTFTNLSFEVNLKIIEQINLKTELFKSSRELFVLRAHEPSIRLSFRQQQQQQQQQ